MRYLALIAVISLQLSIFVCESGIDVCHTDGATSQVQLYSYQSDAEQGSSSVEPCSAHAAHTFLAENFLQERQVYIQIEGVENLASLQNLEFYHLIEQPPKTSHS